MINFENTGFIYVYRIVHVMLVFHVQREWGKVIGCGVHIYRAFSSREH